MRCYSVILFALIAVAIGCKDHNEVIRPNGYADCLLKLERNAANPNQAQWPDQFTAHLIVSGQGINSVETDQAIHKNPTDSLYYSGESIQLPVGIALNINVTAAISGETWSSESNITLTGDPGQTISITLLNTAASMIFVEDFENDGYAANGWITSGNCAIVTESPFSGTRSHKGVGYWSISRNFSLEQSGVHELSWAGMKTSGSAGPVMTYSPVADARIYVGFDDNGAISAYNGCQKYVVLPNNTENVWHSFRVNFDADAETFDLFVDGVQVADRYAFLPLSGLTPQLSFQGSGVGFIDDIHLDIQGAYLPSIPVLMAPINFADNQPLSLTFDWMLASLTVDYQLQLTADSTFTLDIQTQSDISNSAYVISELDSSTTYYWRVRAHNPAGYSDWSQIRTFSTVKDSARIVWTKSFDELGTATALKVIQNDFGGYNILANRFEEESWYDCILPVTYANGELIRANNYPCIGYDLQKTSDRGFVVVGAQFSAGPYGNAISLLKFDLYWNLQWSKIIPGDDERFSPVELSLEQTIDGGYIIALSCFYNSVSRYGYGLFLAKTNEAGQTIWTYGDDSEDFIGKICVHQVDGGGYVVLGQTWSNRRLLKFDSAGNMEWGHDYDYSPSSKFLKAVDGGYVFLGIYSRSLIKTDASGNQIWQKSLPNLDNGLDLETCEDGGYILAGTTDYSGFPPTWKTNLVKVDCDGNELWHSKFNLAFYDRVSVAENWDGDYILTGSIGGSVNLVKFSLASNQ